jgi:hypothetical protein
MSYQYDIEVTSNTFAKFVVHVTHLTGPNKNRRTKDASCYCMTLDEVNRWVVLLQAKFSVPAERTFFKV